MLSRWGRADLVGRSFGVVKLSVGDEVVTVGGILGKVSAIGEGVVTLEVAKDVQIKVQKFQVSSLVPKGTLKG